ncbi:MAG: hypothetical protein RL385_5288 [Pseudomonadota bacterium]
MMRAATLRRYGRLHTGVCAVAFVVTGCAGRAAPPTTPVKHVDMEGLRIVARHDDQGRYEFESYDAAELFERGNRALDAGQCAEAVAAYERIAAEFADSKYVSPALYNAGLCLAQKGERESALQRFERVAQAFPGTLDAKHAGFQAGHLEVDLQRFPQALARADALLATDQLDPAERMEALSLRASALLGLGRLDDAEKQGKEALSFFRTRAEQLAADPYFAAQANYVLGDCLRLRAEAITFPDTTQDEQKQLLVRRAQLLLDAMREYASTIQHTTTIRQTNPKWAAAAGYQIGAMYDRLWHDLMAAPVPATLEPAARQYYPQELAKLIKPLLRHAIRYWELTLMMAERTGAQGEWVEKTRADLSRVRNLMLEQPPGPGGLPQLNGTQSGSGEGLAPGRAPSSGAGPKGAAPGDG